MAVTRIEDFDIWQPGYAGATVTFYAPGSTTKISLYSDYALTVAASNPQVLDRLDKDGVSYGKLTQPLYTDEDYYFTVDGADQSGRIDVPLTDLVDEDASQATVQRTGGSTTPTLAEVLARVVHAEDFGALSGSNSGVTDATLTAAIAQAAADGGGLVLIPAGTYLFADLTIPANVVLAGAGRDVTTIQSTTADKVITINGDRAGLSHLTLDGVSQQAGSIGWYSVANDEIVMIDVRVKRFDIGFHMKGGKHCRWKDFYVTNNLTGGKLHGDTDSGDTGLGDAVKHIAWHGGLVNQNINYGLHHSYEDAQCAHLDFKDIGFESNTGTACYLNGTRHIGWDSCHWTGNTKNHEVLDDTATATDNKIFGLTIRGGYINGGDIDVQDSAEQITFENVELAGPTFNLTTPDHHIVLRDCNESSAITITGETEKLLRQSTHRHYARSVGQTSDATATKAWGLRLEAGQVVFAVARVIGNQRNGENSAEYYMAVSAERPGDTLDYDAQVADFTVGEIITGTDSGATALIVADSDSGGNGTLTLRSISGEFENNEQITDPLGGDALVNGALAVQAAALLGAVDNIRAVREDVAGWACNFVVNGQELEVEVTGAAATEIDWTVDVEFTLG